MSVRFGPRLQCFLDEVHPIILGTRGADGSMHMNPLWFEIRDGLVWLNAGQSRAWYERINAASEATLLVLDPINMRRWAQIQARLLDATTDGADAHIDRLAWRYLGGPYPSPKVDRLTIRLEPTDIAGSENRQPWDV